MSLNCVYPAALQMGLVCLVAWGGLKASYIATRTALATSSIRLIRAASGLASARRPEIERNAEPEFAIERPTVTHLSERVEPHLSRS